MNSYNLKDLLSIKNGKDHKELNDGNIPIFGSGGIMRYGDKAIYNDESILLPRKGTLSNIQYVNKPFWTVDTIYYSVINKKLANPFYLFNFLKCLDLTKLNSGTGVPSMTFNSYYDLNVKLPDLPTQKSIAKVLSDLDSKIEINNKINQELEAMAKLLYDYWFVQFDFPNEQGKPYKSSGGKMVYNKELKREIPEGWEVKKIRQIANTGSGGTPLSTRREFYENGHIPWINSGEVNKPFIVSTNNYITQKGLKNSSAKLFKRGTILMAMYGATAGKVSFIDIEACTNQAICAINPHEDFYRTYIKFGLEDLYKYLINLSSGSARDNLSQDKIRDLKFVIPSDKLIRNFDKLILPSMDKILINLKQNNKLKEQRDWLLPMLMNGQVTVREAEEKLNIAAESSGEYKTKGNG